MRLALLAERNGLPTEVVLDRREWLQGAAGLLALGTFPLILPGCGGEGGSDATDSGPVGGGDGAGGGGGSGPVRVGIVGAGLAGLHCAYRLQEAGVNARVFEAWNRAGGRMFSLKDAYPEGRVAELGGELIDTGHLTMHHLAEELVIKLDDLGVEPAGIVTESYYIGGRFLSDREIVDAFRPVAGRMVSALGTAELDEGEFARIDAMSLHDFLVFECRAVSPLLDLLEVAYTAEYGLDVDQQSPFNLLYLIDAVMPDPFRLVGGSDERFHAHDGSQTFTDRLLEALDVGPLFEHRLVALRREADGRVTLVFDHAGTTVEETFERVVLTLPFTQLRKVLGLESAVGAEKAEVVREVGYGTNAKLVMGFRSPLWRDMYSRDGSLCSSTGFQNTWESSRGQAGMTGLLTNFVGGQRGLELGMGTAEEQAVSLVTDELDVLLPGLLAKYMPMSAVRMHWPTSPNFEGSYLCYRPGQWAFYGSEGVAVDNVHFAGEHTSKEAQGYMEGAAETGAKAALEVLDALGIAPGQGLVTLLGKLESGLRTATSRKARIARMARRLSKLRSPPRRRRGSSP